MSVDFKLHGMKELEKSLLKLEEKVEKKVSVDANRAGAAHYRKALKAKLPRSGRSYPRIRGKYKKDGDNKIQKKSLANSIGITKEKGKNVKHLVGVKNWARAYAHVLEFGSKHQVGKPVWRSTLETETSQMIDVMGAKIKAGIEKHG